jgi:hypothetical protein
VTAAVVLDIILIAIIAEGIGLAVYRRLTGRGMAGREIIAFLGAGGSLMVALRLQAGPSLSVPFMFALTSGLVLHLWFVVQRSRA